MTTSCAALNSDYSHPHAVLGAMVWLMGHSEYHRGWRSRAINVDIVPAIILNQYRLYNDLEGRPVGFATWAFVNSEIRESLIAEQHVLNLSDWKSGSELLFNDFVAPWGHGAWIVNDLRTNIFPDRQAFSLARNLDGSIKKIYRWRGKTASSYEKTLMPSPMDDSNISGFAGAIAPLLDSNIEAYGDRFEQESLFNIVNVSVASPAL